jgi:superfamily II DNA or RNA helicase
MLSTFKPRQHQADLIRRLETGDDISSIVMHVCPGGGKSMIPKIIMDARPHLRVAWFVPRLSLSRQAAQDYAKMGLAIRETGNDIDPSRGTRGFVATHALLQRSPELFQAEMSRAGMSYALVVDEVHHAKRELGNDEANATAKALEMIEPYARLRVYLSGTLETADSTLIHGIKYKHSDDGRGWMPDPQASCDAFIRYSRTTALWEKAIVPVKFHQHDGDVNWGDGSRTLSEVSNSESGRALFAVLNGQLASQVFDSGIRHWNQCQRAGKLIVVCGNQMQARDYHARLLQMNVATSLAITDNDDAHGEVEQFRGTRQPETQALVTCAMAYEGLDVPSASHLICLTNIRSTPWIEQMLGRIWRASPGKNEGHAFVPHDPLMQKVIDQIQAEQVAAIRQQETVGEAPGPGQGRDLLAISHLTDIHERYLGEAPDGDVVQKLRQSLSPEQWRMIQVVIDKQGRDAFDALLQQQQATVPADTRTVRDRERDLRQSITEYCKDLSQVLCRKMARMDWQAGPAWLKTRTGKSLADQCETELQQSLQLVMNELKRRGDAA